MKKFKNNKIFSLRQQKRDARTRGFEARRLEAVTRIKNKEAEVTRIKSMKKVRSMFLNMKVHDLSIEARRELFRILNPYISSSTLNIFHISETFVWFRSLELPKKRPRRGRPRRN